MNIAPPAADFAGFNAVFYIFFVEAPQGRHPLRTLLYNLFMFKQWQNCCSFWLPYYSRLSLRQTLLGLTECLS